MSRRRVLLSLVFLLASSAGAFGDSDYTAPCFSVDGGGGTSSAGTLVLDGTAGQAEAAVLTGGSYWLAGGFWGGGATAESVYPIYLPLVVKNRA